MMGVNMLIDLT